MTDHKQIKEDILNVAKTVFAKYGYQKTTMNDIAKEAHKAKSTLYHYFESKNEIFTLIVKSEMDKMKSHCVSNTKRSDDLVEKLHLFTFSMFDRRVSELFDEYGFTILYDFFHFAPLIKDLVIDQQEFNINYLSSIISKGVEQGIFFTSDSRKTAKALMMSVASLSQRIPVVLIGQDRSTAEHLFDIFIKGLTTE